MTDRDRFERVEVDGPDVAERAPRGGMELRVETPMDLLQ